MSSFLVTGGAGFIGSHIVDRLVSDGHDVRIIDNFSTGKISNIEHNLSKISLIEGDLTDIYTVRNAVKGVDYVLHQAALASVPRSINNPIASNESNVTGTLNLLVASRDAGVKRLIYASSSSVYGNSPTLPKHEDMPTNPLSPYALTKLTAEQYCLIFTRIYGLETIALRYFNVFGPRQDPNSQYAAVIPKFISSIMKGEKPIIYGDGLQSRDFTFVHNNVEANILACTAPQAAVGEVFNIACGEKYTLLDLVTGINRILGTSIEPIFEDNRIGDIKHSLADISKAQKLLKYTPSIGFNEGLDQLLTSILEVG